jgi:hypothetical protein
MTELLQLLLLNKPYINVVCCGVFNQWDDMSFIINKPPVIYLVEWYCDILGFPGNATMKQTCPHNKEADASRQQSKQKA